MDEKSHEFMDALAKQVARVVMASAYLEDSLCDIIAETLKLSTFQANALVRPMGARAKLDLIDRLANTLAPEPQRKGIIKFTAAVKKGIESRNDLVHGQFGHNEKGQTTVRSYSGSSKLTGQPKRWTIQEVSGLGTTLIEFNDLCADIQTLLSSYASTRAQMFAR